MQRAICLLPVAPVRIDPSHRSEMVSQLLFGEYVSIGEEREDFFAVKCLYDGYEGWVQANQLTLTDNRLEITGYVGVAQAVVIIDGYHRHISIGSPVYQPGEPLFFGGTTIQYPADAEVVWVNKKENPLSLGELEKLTNQYLYTPYTWGGRSVYGIDCSGFVQQVMKLFGIALPRDAYQQATQGTAVEKLAAAQCGDLAFFQNEHGRVTHVGILTDPGTIVHAAGRVRIDRIDENGIINRETGRQTHRLHSLRRFF